MYHNHKSQAMWLITITLLRLRQNGHHYPDICKYIFLNENVWISIRILLMFLPRVPIHNKPALVQIMAWHRSGEKSLSEPMLVYLTDAYMRQSAIWFNRLRLRQNGHHSADNISKCIFINKNLCILTLNFTEFFFPKIQLTLWPNWFGSVNDLAQSRWQFIHWNNDSLVYWYALLNVNGLS